MFVSKGNTSIMLKKKKKIWEKEKTYVNILVGGGWNPPCDTIIINFMLIGFVNLSFYYHMCFADFWAKGLVLAYGP